MCVQIKGLYVCVSSLTSLSLQLVSSCWTTEQQRDCGRCVWSITPSSGQWRCVQSHGMMFEVMVSSTLCSRSWYETLNTSCHELAIPWPQHTSCYLEFMVCSRSWCDMRRVHCQMVWSVSLCCLLSSVTSQAGVSWGTPEEVSVSGFKVSLQRSDSDSESQSQRSDLQTSTTFPTMHQQKEYTEPQPGRRY